MSKPLAGVKADHKYSYRKLEMVAQQIRGQMGLTADAPLNALKLFEDLHECTVSSGQGVPVPLSYGVVELEGSEGYTRYEKEKGVIEVLASTQAYDWLQTGHPRGAYFLAHELGHSCLHTDQLIRLAKLPSNQQAAFHRGKVDHQACEDTEWQANNFASALLMPAKGLEVLEKRYSQLSPQLVALIFRVSTEAAGYRLELFNQRRSELLS